MTNNEAGRIGGRASVSTRRAEKTLGMAAAREWRERNRKKNWAAVVMVESGLAFVQPVPCVDHMPFAGHRTQEQVAADEQASPRIAA